MASDFYINREQSYKWPPDNLELVGLTWQEIPMQVRNFVPDPDDPGQTWSVQGTPLQYRFEQRTRTVFTDVGTYKTRQRCIPRTPAHARTLAQKVSLISVQQALASSPLEKLDISEWELVGHEIVLAEPGLYYVTYTMEALSVPKWDPALFKKLKLPTEYELA